MTLRLERFGSSLSANDVGLNFSGVESTLEGVGTIPLHNGTGVNRDSTVQLSAAAAGNRLIILMVPVAPEPDSD